ncbi:MAG: YceI family protein [Pseudomonadota bacterium]
MDRRPRAAASVFAALTIGAASADDTVTIPSGTYANDAGHTRLLWRIDHMGLSHYTARFNDVEIVLAFDAEQPNQSSVTATIDPRSVDTGYPGETDFNAEISDDPRFLDAGNHPEITFVSRKVTATGERAFEIEGDLTMRGQTLPVTLDATLIGALEEHPFAKVPAIGFSATATIDRTAFGLDYLSGGPILGDEVEIEIQTEFLKQ